MSKIADWLKRNLLSLVLFLLGSVSGVVSFAAGLCDVFSAYPGQIVALVTGSFTVGAVICFWLLRLSGHARRKAVLRDMLEAPYEVREVLLSFYRGGGRVRGWALDEGIEYLRRRGLIELPAHAFEGNALIFMPGNVMSVLEKHATEILGDLEGFDGEEGETGGPE